MHVHNILVLTLFGNKFKLNGQGYTAYEGTLLYPGKLLDWSNYADAYKIDFGYQIPSITVFWKS